MPDLGSLADLDVVSSDEADASEVREWGECTGTY